ncbi:Uncharacterised protein [Serratia liquefaciens]|nr:Uncharacterised protein [Serratia liquefaciens]
MRGKSVMLLAGLASLAQANELNLYSVNTGSYVYHLTNNHGQYTENFENHFFLSGAEILCRLQIQPSAWHYE